MKIYYGHFNVIKYSSTVKKKKKKKKTEKKESFLWWPGCVVSILFREQGQGLKQEASSVFFFNAWN